MNVPLHSIFTIVVLIYMAELSLTSSAIGGNCTTKYDCGRGLSCINKSCACESGKIYNPQFTRSFWFCEWTPNWPRDYGACQSPLGAPCDELDDCLTNGCVSGKCACIENTVPDENGGCRCQGATYWKPETNRCIYYDNARFDSNLWQMVCDANQTVRNDTTRSCDCLVVPGDPTSGIRAHTTWKTETNNCVCQSGFTLDPSSSRCVCGVASVPSSDGNYCARYKNAVNGGNQGYICPYTTTQNDETKSCDCEVPVAVFNSRKFQCTCPNKKELKNNCV